MKSGDQAKSLGCKKLSLSYYIEANNISAKFVSTRPEFSFIRVPTLRKLGYAYLSLGQISMGKKILWQAIMAQEKCKEGIANVDALLCVTKLLECENNEDIDILLKKRNELSNQIRVSKSVGDKL